MKRTVLVSLAGILGAVAALLVLICVFQRRMIYIPITRSVAPAASVIPGAEDVAYTTEDGLALRGWFVPPSIQPARGTVILFNGNAGDRSYRAELGEALSKAGLAVLLTDYRGYGGNPGSPSETGLLRDARAARAYVTSRSDVDPARIIYFGESLGAAVAVALAVEEPPAALVLRSPFGTLAEVGKRHYPFLPVSLLLWDRYPSVDRIRDVHCPLLVVAGDADRIIPAEMSQRLFDAANQPKSYALIPWADHNDREFLDGDRFLGEVAGFLAGVL